MKKIVVIILVGVMAIGCYLAYSNYSDRRAGEFRQAQDRRRAEELEKRLTMAKRKVAWEKLKKYIESEMGRYNVEVGLVVKDLDMNWEINSNKDVAIPAASLAKIPIMLAYQSAAKEGKVNLSEKYELKGADKTDGSGILKTFKAGSVFSIDDMIYLMITQSDNTASNILISRLGMETLNQYFARMGFKRTNLSRKMMDFKARKNGIENYTSAGDMALALERLYNGKFIDIPTSKKCLRFLASQKVNDRIPKKLPENTVVAHKTGLENGICHDVGIVYTSKGNFLICVLTKHQNKSARETKRLIQDISLAAYNYYNSF
jgi:beta-lactamase class A